MHVAQRGRPCPPHLVHVGLPHCAHVCIVMVETHIWHCLTRAWAQLAPLCVSMCVGHTGMAHVEHFLAVLWGLCVHTWQTT